MSDDFVLKGLHVPGHVALGEGKQAVKGVPREIGEPHRLEDARRERLIEGSAKRPQLALGLDDNVVIAQGEYGVQQLDGEALHRGVGG